MRFELRPHDGLQLRGFRCVRMVGKTRQKEAQVPLDEVVVSGRVVKFDQLNDIVEDGRRRASAVATRTMDEVRDAMGI